MNKVLQGTIVYVTKQLTSMSGITSMYVHGNTLQFDETKEVYRVYPTKINGMDVDGRIYELGKESILAIEHIYVDEEVGYPVENPQE